jgi:hypothetical protein
VEQSEERSRFCGGPFVSPPRDDASVRPGAETSPVWDAVTTWLNPKAHHSLRECEPMSPESQPNATTSGGQNPERDNLQRASDTSARRLVPSENASGRLPEERGTTGLYSVVFICAWVAVASSAGFVVCGLWQAGAIMRHAQGVVAPHAAAPANSNRRAQQAPANGTASVAPKWVPSPHAAGANEVRGRPQKGPGAPPDTALTVAATTAKVGATAAAFEARAEASERVVPLGLEAALDGTSSDLTLGHPPPPEYPRVGCPEIFVYIVTVAEGAPQRSAASLGVGKQGPARFRRPGERIGDWTVLAISDDWTGLNPDVWLGKDGTVCRAELDGNPSRVHQAPKPPPKPKARRRRR